MSCQRNPNIIEQKAGPDVELMPNIRHAKVIVAMDFGGKSTRAAVYVDGSKKSEHSLLTHRHSRDDPVSERVGAHTKNMLEAIDSAVKKADVNMSDVDSVVFGAPGARHNGRYRMPNAIGEDPETGKLAEVDMETPLKRGLGEKGLREDAIVRGYNDVDIAAASNDLGKNPIFINRGAGEFEGLTGREEYYFILLGTGIGVGIRDRFGINEGASGAQEGGHVEVHTDLPADRFRCGCGKHNPGSVCIEAVASTTGQERLAKHLVMQEFQGQRPMRKNQMRILLSETRKDNIQKLETGAGHMSEKQNSDLKESVLAAERLLEGLDSFEPSKKYQNDVEALVFDSKYIDKLARGKPPLCDLAADAMRISGKHLGRFIRSITAARNPKTIVIGGGGALAFKYGSKYENPLWQGMESELGPENDPHDSIKNAWIVAVADPDVNLGMDGCVAMGKRLFMES